MIKRRTGIKGILKYWISLQLVALLCPVSGMSDEHYSFHLRFGKREDRFLKVAFSVGSISSNLEAKMKTANITDPAGKLVFRAVVPKYMKKHPLDGSAYYVFDVIDKNRRAIQIILGCEIDGQRDCVIFYSLRNLFEFNHPVGGRSVLSTVAFERHFDIRSVAE